VVEHLTKLAEQVIAVVRAGRSLWVVLHGEGEQVLVVIAKLETLDDVVVETDVADRCDPVRGHGRLAERGVDAQMDDVARRADVGVGTVYRHFPTKDALLDALADQVFELLAAHARELLELAAMVEGEDEQPAEDVNLIAMADRERK